MISLCKFCGSIIFHAKANQMYCDENCRSSARYFKQVRSTEDQEGRRRAATVWKERQTKGLQKNVCLYCLEMCWTPEPYEFCSEGCEKLYKGGK